MKLTEGQRVEALKALHQMNGNAGGHAALASMIFEAAARNPETRQRGADALGDCVKTVFGADATDDTNEDCAAVAAALREITRIRKMRSRGETMMAQDDPIVRATGEDHHDEVRIKHQRQKEMLVISCIQDALKKTGTPPTAAEVLERLDGYISPRMIYTVFEKVSARTGLTWDDQREKWVWPEDKCNSA